MPASSVNLNRLAAFAAVVETGSFTAAAERLGLTKAMVSLHVSRLEKELGIALLTRTTRKVAPTEAGAAFHADCGPVLQEMEAAIARVGGQSEEPAGTLRLTAPEDYGSALVVPALSAFMRLHPKVRVEFLATDEVVDLVGGRHDLGIRVGWLRESSLRATRLGGFRQFVVASPAYLKAARAPRHPRDLPGLSWAGLSTLRSAWTWHFASRGRTQTVRITPAVTTNSAGTLRAFLREGAGVGILPDYMLAGDLAAGRLVRLLPGWNLPEGGVHAVYPNVRYTSAKVRAFVDFLRDHLAQDQGEGVTSKHG
jgi:DNA-binding transcriptional LysR family regulator